MPHAYKALALIATLALPMSADAAPARRAAPRPSATTPAPVPARAYVTLSTASGNIVLELNGEKAPVSTANFLRYVDQHRLDGTTFYRAVNVGQGAGLIQGGTRNAPRRVLPPIAHEPTNVTGLSHIDGAISYARLAPGSATADFFITVGALTSLDAHPGAPGDNAGFAVFGRVVQGMDVVRAILSAPINPAAGAENGMQGQMIAAPVTITRAVRSEAPAPPLAPATPPPATPAAPQPVAQP